MGLPIFSLYGANKSPDVYMLQEVDVVFCDLQDIGQDIIRLFIQWQI